MVSADARLRRESVIVGDDGKWNKCEAQLSDMDVNGEIKCEAEGGTLPQDFEMLKIDDIYISGLIFIKYDV